MMRIAGGGGGRGVWALVRSVPSGRELGACAAPAATKRSSRAPKLRHLLTSVVWLCARSTLLSRVASSVCASDALCCGAWTGGGDCARVYCDFIPFSRPPPPRELFSGRA